MIKVNNICKDFEIQKRTPGLKGTIKDLFHREYTIKEAVKNISFEIPKGEIVGYIGPNGAGKSTTIKMLSGILVPTSGKIEIDGLEPHKDRVANAKNIGVVFGQRSQLWWDIPISESLNLMKYMYDIPENVYQENLKIFKNILGINDFINMPARQLSLGQRMRADFACALIHNPKILYLDEPTIGLDVFVKENIRELIKEINKLLGTTIILTTHDMFDIEKLCSRVMVIDKGTLIYDGTIDFLKNKYGKLQTIKIELGEEYCIPNSLNKLGIKEIKQDGNSISISYDKSIINSTVILSEFIGKISVKDFKIYESNIDEVINEMYKTLPSIGYDEKRCL